MPYLDVNYGKRKKGHEVEIIEKPKILVVVCFHYNPASGATFRYLVAVYLPEAGQYRSRSNYYPEQAAQRPDCSRGLPFVTL